MFVLYFYPYFYFYFTVEQLVDGNSQINVWGREVTVCDMDEFTEHHYKSKFNVGKLIFTQV